VQAIKQPFKNIFWTLLILVKVVLVKVVLVKVVLVKVVLVQVITIPLAHADSPNFPFPLSTAQSMALLGACGDRQFQSFYDIADIQNPENSTLGQWVVVESIVSFVSQGQGNQDGYRGFWLQQPKAKAFAGLFVYHAETKVRRGQRIRLLAQVAEYHEVTELKNVRAVKVCSDQQVLPESIPLILPVSSLAELEALEGMRVHLRQPLIISDLYGAGYGLGNYGQFAISTRLHFQPTELFSAASIRRGTAPVVIKSLDYLLVDDGQAKPYPSHIPFPDDRGFSSRNSLKIGDKIQSLTGVLHQYDEHYIIIPDPMSGPVKINSLDRSQAPKVDNKANLVIASMNLENFFNGSPTNIKQPDVGFPTPRGAKSYLGYLAQKQKLVAALAAINADVIALMELENDGYGKYSAIADLMRALNKELNVDQHYQYIIPPTSKLGRDVISIGILYRGNKVKALGAVDILDSGSSKYYSINSERTKLDRELANKTRPLFDDSYHRPSLLQTFSVNNKTFSLAVNHFKSKGRPCHTSEVDNLQGQCNLQRLQASLALAEFIREKVPRDRPVLIVGDLNSYSQEEPLLALYKAGYHNLNNSVLFSPNKGPSFSYSYQGYLSNLDHALANSAMLAKVRSFDSWHINSIEDSLLGYQTEANGQAYRSIDHYSAPDAYRSSDHDPLVIGIKF